MSTLEQLKTILAEYKGKWFAIDKKRETLTPYDWQGIANKCEDAQLQCTPDDDGIWFLDGKLTVDNFDGNGWQWVWTPNSERFGSVQADAGEDND